MLSQADHDYFSKRVRDERALAKSATDADSARAHADMAAHSERLLAGEPASSDDGDFEGDPHVDDKVRASRSDQP